MYRVTRNFCNFCNFVRETGFCQCNFETFPVSEVIGKLQVKRSNPRTKFHSFKSYTYLTPATERG